MRTRIKFCGCTSVADALAAVDAGADAIGLIFADSPRRVDERSAAEIARELPPFVTPVGVFADHSREDIDRIRERIPGLAVQLHGQEAPAFAASFGSQAIKALHVAPQAERDTLSATANEYPACVLLFDTASGLQRGGTGVVFNWTAVRALARARRVIVAGGLTAANVGECIHAVRPFGVDVRSGIETNGAKDAAKMNAFVRAVREADAS